jgi:hypothetical protein
MCCTHGPSLISESRSSFTCESAQEVRVQGLSQGQVGVASGTHLCLPWGHSNSWCCLGGRKRYALTPSVWGQRELCEGVSSPPPSRAGEGHLDVILFRVLSMHTHLQALS